MSNVTANHLKKGQLFYLESEKKVFKVLEVVQMTHGNHKVKVKVEDFSTSKHTEHTFSVDAKVRLVEFTSKNYSLTGFADRKGDLDEHGHLYLSLQDETTGNQVEHLYVKSAEKVNHVKNHFASSDVPLSARVTSVFVDSYHSFDKDSDQTLERVTHIEGLDEKHLHDKHHDAHHVHQVDHGHKSH